MQELNAHDLGSLLKLIRSNKMDELGRAAVAYPALEREIRRQLEARALEALPRQCGLAARQLFESAILSLEPLPAQADHDRLRAFTLLDRFYLHKDSREAALKAMSLGGGSFDRVKAHALPLLAEALQARLAQPAGDESTPAQGRVSSVPWLTPRPILRGAYLPYRPYRVLWGRARELEHLITLLSDPAGPAVVSLSGLGGNGKTALAREAAERLAARPVLEDVLWVSAQRETMEGTQRRNITSVRLDVARLVDMLIVQTGLAEMSRADFEHKSAALAELFRAKKYLIVLDNLDDSDDEIGLVRAGLSLLGRSRLLVTTRHRTLDQLPIVQPFPLGGLTPEDTLVYLKQEASFRGLSDLAQRPAAELARVYDFTGGAPLAMNLVLGQAQVWSLETALEHLENASGQDQDLYSYLFWQDWRSLDEPAQRLLIFLGRVIPTSVSEDQLRRMQGQERGLDAALESLVRLSLVETSSGLLPAQQRFGVHPLVRHFVLSELPHAWTPHLTS